MTRSLVLSLFLFTATLLSAQVKLGFVDSETILRQMPDAISADKRLQTQGKLWQDTLESMSRDYQTRLENYKKSKGMMTEEAKQKEEGAIVEMQQHVLEFRDAKFGTQGELALRREEYLKPVREKIETAIKRVAKDNKLSFVFDRASGIGVLYADEQYDVTYKVLDKLKSGK